MTNLAKTAFVTLAILLIDQNAFAVKPRYSAMPKTLTLPEWQYPVWVDASVALLDGKPNTALLGPSASRLAEILSSPLDNGCHAVGPVYSQVAYPEPRDTLNDAVTHSRSNVLGLITGSAYGFYGGVAGQLFRVAPVRTFGEPVPSGPLYFFVPSGRFKIGDDEICKYDSSYAQPPSVGGEVFLFVGRAISNTVFNVSAEDVVPVDARGALSLPARFSGKAAVSNRDDLVRRILREKTEWVER